MSHFIDSSRYDVISAKLNILLIPFLFKNIYKYFLMCIMAYFNPTVKLYLQMQSQLLNNGKPHTKVQIPLFFFASAGIQYNCEPVLIHLLKASLFRVQLA